MRPKAITKVNYRLMQLKCSKRAIFSRGGEIDGNVQPSSGGVNKHSRNHRKSRNFVDGPKKIGRSMQPSRVHTFRVFRLCVCVCACGIYLLRSITIQAAGLVKYESPSFFFSFPCGCCTHLPFPAVIFQNFQKRTYGSLARPSHSPKLRTGQTRLRDSSRFSIMNECTYMHNPPPKKSKSIKHPL